MSELNLENQGPRKNKNKKDAHQAPNPFKLILLLIGVIFVVSLLSQIANHQPVSGGDPVSADYKPPEPQPARAVDDGLGTLIIFPPTMQYRAEAIDEAMKKAKDEWKKQHPERMVVAVLNNTRDPSDYGYRWVIFYEEKR